MPQPANRLFSFPDYPLATLGRRVEELRAQGIDIINLDVGSPDMPPPDVVIDTLCETANKSNTHGYSGYRGLKAFREAVARYYARRFGVEIDPETQVLPLVGSKEGIVNLCLAYLDHGDVALVPDIGYPSYSLGAYLAGASVHWIPVSEEAGYLPDFEALSQNLPAGAKLLWLNYPNNPTGAVASPDFYQRAVNFCRKHDLLLASDNPYVDVTYDGFHASSVLQAAGALENTIEFISFSKTYNMAGWRLGAAVSSQTTIKNLLQVKSNFDSGHFIPIYESGITAIDEISQSWIHDRNMVYQRRRDIMLEVLPQVGLAPFHPGGALYVWAKVTDPSLNGASYAEQALINAHVSMAPGIIYGPGGTQYVRLSMCTTDDRLRQALERLKHWYQERS
ncbi:MAG: aminotransferase class I/II-fold pyridoxal phosphate-dependent enzyme [Anaerolineae bacterium]|nr:aminotransferase class I/II-fold pyridoxal phosphate-dependent enzyme [Anaerolineae bacterium]